MLKFPRFFKTGLPINKATATSNDKIYCTFCPIEEIIKWEGYHGPGYLCISGVSKVNYKNDQGEVKFFVF
jgi:hypothetical protein